MRGPASQLIGWLELSFLAFLYLPEPAWQKESTNQLHVHTVALVPTHTHTERNARVNEDKRRSSDVGSSLVIQSMHKTLGPITFLLL